MRTNHDSDWGGTLLNVLLVGALLSFAGPVAAQGYGGKTFNVFGGAPYLGKPSLSLTSALVKAGGGPRAFKIQEALVSMLGQKTVTAEVSKLTKQYGAQSVENWLAGLNLAVADGLKRATAAGVSLPAPPARLRGADLARAIVEAGLDKGSTFWAGHLFDELLSHKVHDQVMKDADAARSVAFDENLHRDTNQALYDVAQALGMKNVKLAVLH